MCGRAVPFRCVSTQLGAAPLNSERLEFISTDRGPSPNFIFQPIGREKPFRTSDGIAVSAHLTSSAGHEAARPQRFSLRKNSAGKDSREAQDWKDGHNLL